MSDKLYITSADPADPRAVLQEMIEQYESELRRFRKAYDKNTNPHADVSLSMDISNVQIRVDQLKKFQKRMNWKAPK